MLSRRRVTIGLGNYKLDYTSTIVGRLISTIVYTTVYTIAYTIASNRVYPGLTIGELAYRIAIHSIGSFEIRCLDTRDDSLSQRLTTI